jgi:tetratricopeptide (TPR) repeat protein
MCHNVDTPRELALTALGNGDLVTAFSLMSESLEKNSLLDDVYLTGELALDLGLYCDAINFLTRVISQSINENEGWYIESAYIGRAYAWAKIGEFSCAREDIIKAGEDAELFWLKNHPFINKTVILSIISARESLNKP